MKQIELSRIIEYLDEFAPLGLAEDWDNVGLLVGDRQSTVSHGLTCLTVTPEVVDEAIDMSANLIVSHHPMPFQPLKKITSDSVTGRMILDLCRNAIAVYSPHTAFDSTDNGINQMIAERIGLEQIKPLKPIAAWDAESIAQKESADVTEKVIGIGRQGVLAQSQSCQQLCDHLAEVFQLKTVKLCGNRNTPVERIGIACGSAGQFLGEAASQGCDAFITGETNFHTCLEARARSISLFLLGHYGSERFAVEALATRLSTEFPTLNILPSSRGKRSSSIRFSGLNENTSVVFRQTDRLDRFPLWANAS